MNDETLESEEVSEDDDESVELEDEELSRA